MSVRVLSFHADYRCRNAGVCCSSHWPIPVEDETLARLTSAIETRRLAPVSTGTAPFERRARITLLAAAANGHCVFHHGGGSCAIQSALGHGALPLACRQFPRVTVVDPRGTSVTLSHYCPTAASLLSSNSERGEGEQANIRVNPPMFPESGEYVGLDARTPLPPLLRPGLLMDWESWWLIERRAVDLLLSAGRSASDALNQLRLVISSILSWRPEDGPLGTRVNDAFRSPSARGRRAAGDLLNVLVNSVPGEFLEKTHWTPSVAPTDLVARRFLAAHAFANWPVHLGQGLRTWFLSIETAALLLHEGAGVSHADLLLRHLVDPRAWSTALDRTIGYNPLSS